ncbi:hypothetical protein NPS34_26980 [Pseudomonas putida]|uniref:Uncharacterized protein n=1 Tax=Pseudomonas putida (strain ATCC 700007 / DSM 6899 / JCM 31910 / BCRC 17059 / LMG 24140 / F1) TaxID=351746 RepID=A5W5S3_PSEP1|nr:hypothetical protein [Pseudomonas putida]MDD2001679.1 hypothetical protein [Pseudomonas putida]HDS1791814.1 hypothetical protein [Pseudomonas putida]
MQQDEPSADDLNLYRAVECSPPGSWRMFTADKIGVQNYIKQHFKNSKEVKTRIQIAVASNCQIEVISLRLQVIDYWLRLYLENSDPNIQREREFGRLIRQARQVGLPIHIYDKLVSFNNTRKDAIHGYIVGTTCYDEIKKEAIDCKNLLIETITYVVNNSGVIVTSRNDLYANPGAITMDVAWFCQNLADNCEY